MVSDIMEPITRFSEHYVEPIRFKYTDINSEQINTMNDLIGCRLEARTSELTYCHSSEPEPSPVMRRASTAVKSPWLMQGHLVPEGLLRSVVRAANGLVEWRMEPRDNGLAVRYRDDSGDNECTAGSVYKYSFFIRRRYAAGNTSLPCQDTEGQEQPDHLEDVLPEPQWLTCRRIFHLPERPAWNSLDAIIAGDLPMPAALPYPIDPSSRDPSRL
mmetsp:Transcript_110269/g.276085  ORF Transcript_110269/g.276085 Transcript_110269/m.276085 type:complete len:215 (+) Transcript_110269:1-645(+)